MCHQNMGKQFKLEIYGSDSDSDDENDDENYDENDDSDDNGIVRDDTCRMMTCLKSFFNEWSQ